MPKPTRKRPPVKPPKVVTPTPADEAAYLETLIKTGQAVPAGRGPLPSGATHVLETDAVGQVKAVRRRVSIA